MRLDPIGGVLCGGPCAWHVAGSSLASFVVMTPVLTLKTLLLFIYSFFTGRR